MGDCSALCIQVRLAKAKGIVRPILCENPIIGAPNASLSSAARQGAEDLGPEHKSVVLELAEDEVAGYTSESMTKGLQLGERLSRVCRFKPKIATTLTLEKSSA